MPKTTNMDIMAIIELRALDAALTGSGPDDADVVEVLPGVNIVGFCEDEASVVDVALVRLDMVPVFDTDDSRVKVALAELDDVDERMLEAL